MKQSNFDFQYSLYRRAKDGYLLFPSIRTLKDMRKTKLRMFKELSSEIAAKQDLIKQIEHHKTLLKEVEKELSRWEIDMKKLLKIAAVGKAVYEGLKDGNNRNKRK